MTALAKTKIACVVVALLSATPSVAGSISQKDAGQLASFYFQSQDANSDMLSSASSTEEGGPEGLRIRTCIIFMALDFSEVRDRLHIAGRDALFASNLATAHDRKNASILLESDLEALDKITSATRDEINRQQGTCSSSALISQKAQIILGILSNIASTVGALEIKLSQ